MGSAKTALLLTTAYNFEERGVGHICLKPVVDTRENTNIIRSRIGIERECVWIYPETDLYSLARSLFESRKSIIEWFLIDEAQFLTESQVDQLARIVDNFGCNVICYGLRTDFRTHLFEGSKRLLEVADSIDEVKSTCSCGRKTIVNARVNSQGEIITEGEVVEIGGNERYIAVCRNCWRNKRIEQSRKGQLPI